MKRAVGRKIFIFMWMLPMLLLWGCSPEDREEAPPGEPADYGKLYRLSEADRNVETAGAEEISFPEGGDVLLIDKAGEYLLQGSHDGQILIDAEDGIVRLILKDAELRSYAGPAIYVRSASKAVLTVPEGSGSIVRDSTNYRGYDDAEACIFSSCDLTVNGGGSLQVYGYYKDAVRTKDVLKLLDVDLEVQAKDTGLRGNDGVAVRTGKLSVQCEGTGIYTKKENRENRGYVDLAGGGIDIIAGKYGVDASENVYIHDCSASIYGVVQNIRCAGEQYVEEGCLE